MCLRVVLAHMDNTCELHLDPNYGDVNIFRFCSSNKAKAPEIGLPRRHCRLSALWLALGANR